MAVTAIRDGEPLALGQATQSSSSQSHDSGAVAAPQRVPLAVVTLPGAIDITNDGQLQDSLTRALRDGTAVLIADASGTTFCGCSGVTALVLAHHRAAAAGTQLRVVAASPAMRRILELTGADHVLDTYPTLAAAVAGRSRTGPHVT